MKDEQCLIGHPCKICIKQCTFRRDSGADEKENKKNERITQESKD